VPPLVPLSNESVHNTFPIVKQLIFKLERGVCNGEFRNLLSNGVDSRLAHPFHHNFPHATIEMGEPNLLQLRQHSTMLNRRKESHNNRWGADELFQKHHMKDIDLGGSLSLDAIGPIPASTWNDLFLSLIFCRHWYVFPIKVSTIKQYF
jgi:hypothetical protein